MSEQRKLSKKSIVLIIIAGVILLAGIIVALIYFIDTKRNSYSVTDFSVDNQFYTVEEGGSAVFSVRTTSTPTLFLGEEEIGDMLDDGNGVDAAAGDGVYSLSVDIKSTEEAIREYRVGFTRPKSDPVKIYINTDPTQEEISTFLQEVDNINKLDDEYEKDGYVPTEQTQEILDIIASYTNQLIENNTVGNYYIGTENITIRFVSGLTAIYAPNIKEKLEGENDPAVEVISLVQTNDVDASSIDDSLKKITDTFKNCSETTTKDSELTLQKALNSFKPNSLIMWLGHAIYTDTQGIIIPVGENVSEELYKPHDWLNGKLVSLNGKIGVTSDFIKNNCEDLSGSIVYMNTCYSAKDETLANVFIEKGAKGFVGNTDAIIKDYAISIQADTLSQMIEADDNTNLFHTLGEALSIAQEKHGANDSEKGGVGAETKIIGEDAKNYRFSNDEKKLIPTKYNYKEISASEGGLRGFKGVVTASDDKGRTVWTYETKFIASNPSRSGNIGERSNGYYIYDDCRVVLLNKLDGKTIWKSEYLGAGIEGCFDGNNNLYITIFDPGDGDVPDAAKLNSSGKTLWTYIGEWSGAACPSLTNGKFHFIYDYSITGRDEEYLDPSTGEKVN